MSQNSHSPQSQVLYTMMTMAKVSTKPPTANACPAKTRVSPI